MSKYKCPQVQIAELERKVATLREACAAVVTREQRRMYEACPDCDYHDRCSADNICHSVPLSPVGKLAQEALAGTAPAAREGEG